MSAYKYYIRDTLLCLFVLCWGVVVQAQIVRPGSFEETRMNAQQEVKNMVEPQLLRYCGQGCELIRVDVDVKEAVDENTELGFEAVVGDAAKPRLVIERVNVNIQVDDNITSQNRDRLKSILLNHLRGYAYHADVVWSPVTIPNIGSSSSSSSALQRQLETQLEQTVNKALQTYCPDKCLLAYVGVKGQMINADEAESLNRNEIVRDISGKSFMQINSATIELSMDEALDDASRERITNVIRANTRYASPVTVNVTVSQFPTTYADKMRKENDADPYGLEKLRQMLIMFRDLASTKEIITNSSEKVNSSTSKEALERASSNSSINTNNNSKESALNKTASIDSRMSTESGYTDDWLMYIGLAFAGVLVIFLFMRYTSAQKDAKIMMAQMDSAQHVQPQQGVHGHRRIERYDDNGQPVYAEVAGGSAYLVGSSPQEIAVKLKAQKLKDEMIRHFAEEPRVAKETFSRMLKEDGVELTSKYLHIFGHMIILELIEDPALARDLYALSEYFNRSKLDLSQQEELDLLQALKNRQTASEIKVLTSKGSDKFSFLDKLDPTQVFTLIMEEKPQVQSIVLTQLDKKKRMAVFDMYQGGSKVQLMNELCRADAIPREFLSNVAKALTRKIESRPEFDTQNIRSSEIIIDLLERSSLTEQRQIMAHLRSTNVDTARGIMMKVVTLEFLNYLKDGHLIEIILGMDREDLVTFLAGTTDHIRNLLMSKAPYELVETWLEELNAMTKVDENNYKLVELKIFNKIRNLANTGVINILDINEMIYSADHSAQTAPTMTPMSRNVVVA